MKILLIGFLTLACLGTIKAEVKLYATKAERIILEPIDKNRRIGKVDLKYSTKQELSRKANIEQTDFITGEQKLFEAKVRSNGSDGNKNHALKEKQAFSQISKPANKISATDEIMEHLILFFDMYGIAGGFVAIILLFACIRYSVKL